LGPLRIFSKIRGDIRSSVDTGGKLPPVSLTPAAKFAAGIVDTSGKVSTTQAKLVAKFSTDINNTSETGGKIFRRCC
jgi:hypothetical protein